MLTTTQIQDLNRLMLGLGAPIQKDDVGYNSPDFCRMEDIGMLRVDLTTGEAYEVLRTLQHYKKTQLSDYCEDLEETLAEYEKAEKTAKRRTKADYDQRELILYGVTEDSFILGFREYVECNIREYGRWTRLESGKSAMAITFGNIVRFLKYVSDKGKYGYKASADLLKAIEDHPKEEKKETPQNIILTPTGQKNSYGYDLYELNVNNYGFNQKLWSLKGKCLKYVDSKTDSKKVIISTTDKMLPELLTFLVSEHVDISEVTTKPIIDRNHSECKLIDVTKLDMPFDLYPFQIEDAEVLVSRKKALLGSDMGCGKTIISAVVGLSIPGKKLVICPETLRLNWIREIHFANRNADAQIVYSKDAKNDDIIFGEWTVMGYKTAVKFSDRLAEVGFSCMFVDEAHKAKAVTNYGKPGSQQAETVMMLASKIEHVYLLTGTPMPTRNKDLYNPLVMLGELDPTEKYSFHKFGVEFCDGHKNGYGWDYTGSSNTAELHRMLKKYMVRRLKSEVLPNLKKQRIPILTDAKLSKEYKDIEKRLYCMEDDDTYMGLAMSGRRVLSKCKIATAIEFAEDLVETDESVVIVAEFNETLDALMDHFGDTACCIRGGMNDADKQKAIDEFQSGKKKVCCINLIAAGVGITLTKAHNMVIIDYDWTPANMTQVEDRICRTGQTQPCNIYYICHNDAVLDQIFIEMITEKSENIDRVVDDAENTVDLVKMKKSADFFTRLKRRVGKK